MPGWFLASVKKGFDPSHGEIEAFFFAHKPTAHPCAEQLIPDTVHTHADPLAARISRTIPYTEMFPAMIANTTPFLVSQAPRPSCRIATRPDDCSATLLR